MSKLAPRFPRPRRPLALLTLCALTVACGGSSGDDSSGSETSGGGSSSAGSYEDSTNPDPVGQLRRFIADNKIDIPGGNSSRTKLPKPPNVAFDPDKTYTWVLETNKGVIDVRLMPDVAPMHVSSTIFLTEAGFYDGLRFHRVIKGFMAQGGCPLGLGNGNPGYRFEGEFSSEVRHTKKGLLSMANSGPNTDGSQFFLTFAPTPHLDGLHTIFGEVVDGFDVLDALEACGGASGRTSENLAIDKATIRVD